MSPDDLGRSNPVGPFIDPPEDFIIARIGITHKLIVNKYCVYRPMLVLHTSSFAPQTDDLDEVDLAAAWTILRRFKSPQMIIYNCGVDAGSSQGHKHLQIFPRSDSDDFHLWPSNATSLDGRFIPPRKRLCVSKIATLTISLRGIKRYPRSTFQALCNPHPCGRIR